MNQYTCKYIITSFKFIDSLLFGLTTMIMISLQCIARSPHRLRTAPLILHADQLIDSLLFNCNHIDSGRLQSLVSTSITPQFSALYLLQLVPYFIELGLSSPLSFLSGLIIIVLRASVSSSELASVSVSSVSAYICVSEMETNKSDFSQFVPMLSDSSYQGALLPIAYQGCVLAQLSSYTNNKFLYSTGLLRTENQPKDMTFCCKDQSNCTNFYRSSETMTSLGKNSAYYQ